MSPGCSTSAVWMWRGRAAGWRLLLRWEEFGWVQTFLWVGVSNQGLSLNLALLGMSIKAKQQLFWSYEDDEWWMLLLNLEKVQDFDLPSQLLQAGVFPHVLHHCCHVSFQARQWRSVIPSHSHPAPPPLRITASWAPHQTWSVLSFCVSSSSSVDLLDQL